MLQEEPFDEDTGRADHDRRDHQRRPVTDPDMLQQQVGGERAHHVLRAVAEIDDVEHAENDRKPEAQQRVERAVDEAEQQLPEQRLRREAENLEHCVQSVTSGQPPFLSGRKASAAGTVARSL
jgi:hypothetical protein